MSIYKNFGLEFDPSESELFRAISEQSEKRFESHQIEIG